MKQALLLFVLIVSLTACKKDKEDDPQKPTYLTVPLQIEPDEVAPYATSDGNFILFTEQSNILSIVKISQTGSLVWTKQYQRGALNFYSINDVVEDNNHNIYLCGSVINTATNTDMFLLKLNASGDSVFTKTYGDVDIETASNIIQTTDGNLLIGGNSHNEQTFISDLCLVKINTDGMLIWENILDIPGNQNVLDLIQTSDGGYFCTSRTSTNSNNPYFVKTDANGQFQWDKQTTFPIEAEVSETKEIAGGGYISCGYLANDVTEEYDFFLFKMDAGGNVVWSQKLGSTANDDQATSVVQNADGSFTAVGVSANLETDKYDAVIGKVSASGEKQGYTYFGSTNDAFATGIFKEPNGNNLITGVILSPDIEAYSFFITRTDANGNFIP